jgi:hypothetical protein
VQDGLGKLWMSGGQPPGGDCNYWVSFLDGMQRVLLFTANPNIARDAQAAADLEAVTTEVSFCLHGLGLSLVSQQEKKMVELLYMGIARYLLIRHFLGICNVQLMLSIFKNFIIFLFFVYFI